MIAHVMRYLSVSDRCEAALVSKRWYEASLDPALQKDTIFDLHAALNDDDPVSYILRRRGLHLALDNLDGFTKSKSDIFNRCKEIGENLRELSLKASDVSEMILMSILFNCYHLNTLDLSGCNSLFMSGQFLSKQSDTEKLKEVLQNLENLSLANIRYLSNVTFKRITGICRNLKKLSLAGCQILFHSGSYFGTNVSKENSAVLTFEIIQEYVKENTQNITSLNLSRTALTNEALEELAKTPLLNLKELNILGCKDLTDRGIQLFCKVQKNIEVLNLALNVEFTDSCLNSVAEQLKNLKHLDLSKCRQLTHMGAAKLSSLHKLTYLDTSSCFMLSSAGLDKGLCTPNRASLVHLNLSGCTQVNDQFMLRLCNTASNLSFLDVSSCIKITDNSVHAVSTRLKYLRVLRTSWCREITDCGLLGITRPKGAVKRPPILQHDDGQCVCTRSDHLSDVFNKPRKVGDNQGLPQQISCCRLSNIGALIELDLSACHQITDFSVIEVMRFKELRILKLSMCPKLTDDSLVTVTKFQPSLEDLSLSHCNKITDYGIDLVAKKLKRLTNLNVQNCEKLTNHSIESLYVYALRLKHLNVSVCCNITVTAAEQLENRNPNAVQVSKRLLDTGN